MQSAAECPSDEVLAARSERELESGVRDHVDLHLDSCTPCRLTIAALATAAQGDQATASDEGARARPAAPGDRVGRFVLLERVGQGNMGDVWSAYDTDLDRQIAVKLLRVSAGHLEHELMLRLRREAQAMARLSQPNVIAIHELGSDAGRLFCAMELVDGPTLREWCATSRDWRDTLRVLIDAGRGLAAAHEVGLIHRDFKPENVLIARDGRARVGDFGLAQLAIPTLGDGAWRTRSGDPLGMSDLSIETTKTIAAGSVTRTGSLVGTPAYMSPEQIEAGEIDHRSDQFAFCVTAYEALVGARPFAGRTLRELLESIRARDLGAAVRQGIPRRVRAIVSRGLHFDKRQRYPTMESLLSELERARAARPARWIALAAGTSVVIAASALVTTAQIRDSRGGAQQCLDAEAAFEQVWNPRRQQDIQSQFSSLGLPFAEDSWSAVSRTMAAFGERWTAVRTEACKATRVSGVQSDLVLTVRMQCLERSLAEARALTDALATADAETVSNAPAAVERLSVTECSNVPALLAPVPPPRGAAATEVAAIVSEVDRVRALASAGRCRDALPVATALVERARACDHAPTLALTLNQLGECQLKSAAFSDAEATLREAFAKAKLGNAESLAASIAVALAFATGERQYRFETGLEWAFHASIALQRSGNDPDVEAQLASAVGHIRYGQGDYAAAREHYQKAVDASLRLTGAESVGAAKALFNLGRAVRAGGDVSASLTLSRRAVEVLRARLGPRHPAVSFALNGYGVSLNSAGDFAEGLRALDEARSIAVPALGDRHEDVGRIEINRSEALSALGRYDEALATLENVIAVFDHDGADGTLVYLAVRGIGDVYGGRGDHARALAFYRRYLAKCEAMFGAAHDETATALESVAGALLELDRLADAKKAYQRVLSIRDASNAPDSFQRAYALAGLGEIEMRYRHPSNAVPLLRHAVALYESHAGDPAALAEVRFALARAIWDSGGRRAESLALARESRAVLATLGPASKQALSELLAWQRARKSG